jgi:hypothetical protein
MRLLALNGSPRGARSNTRQLLACFTAGFLDTAGNQSTTLDLVRPSDCAAALEGFAGSDAVLLGFPLYTDAMPGLVKDFIERLGALPRPARPPRLLFLVQSGFPEATHTAPIGRYLQRLARRLGCECVGVIRRGGVEGVRVQPSWMTKPLLSKMHELGAGFGRSGVLDPAKLAALAGRDRIAKWALRLACAAADAVHWNRYLKANGALAARFNAPYGEPAPRPGAKPA